jgi:DNA-binding PadR family transcriptional regulator
MNDSTPKEIAAQWSQQMQKGYLKLALLYILTRNSIHGYDMIKRLNKLSVGAIKPTTGGLYPTLKDLEVKNLIKGEWSLKPDERKKIYKITLKGKEVLKEAINQHLKLSYSIRRFLLAELEELGFITKEELVIFAEPFAKNVFHWKQLSSEKQIEELNQQRERLEKILQILPKIVNHIRLVEKNIKQKEILDI